MHKLRTKLALWVAPWLKPVPPQTYNLYNPITSTAATNAAVTWYPNMPDEK